MFAMLEAQTILATMMQHVQLELAVTKPVELDTLVTLRPKDDLLMRIEERRPITHPASTKNSLHSEIVLEN
jgi:cytochrome P450